VEYPVTLTLIPHPPLTIPVYTFHSSNLYNKGLTDTPYHGRLLDTTDREGAKERRYHCQQCNSAPHTSAKDLSVRFSAWQGPEPEPDKNQATSSANGDEVGDEQQKRATSNLTSCDASTPQCQTNAHHGQGWDQRCGDGDTR
jgi:hypothetical protein